MRYLRWDETLFKNESVFDSDYLPDTLLHRESQLAALAANLRPALRNSTPIHTLLFGPPATGKTSVMKTLLNEISDYAYTVYNKMSPHEICIQGHGKNLRACMQTSTSANGSFFDKALRFDMPETRR